MSNNTSKAGQQANPIKAKFAVNEVPWFDIKSPLDIETFHCGSASYTVKPDKNRQQVLAEAAYNRNSMEEKMRKFRDSSNSARGLWNSVTVNNVSSFNRYIYNRIVDIAKQELNDEASIIGDIAHKESLQSFVDLYNNVYASNVYASKDGVYYTHNTVDSLPPMVLGNYIPMNNGTQLFAHDYYDYYSDLVDLMHRYDGFGRPVNDDVKNWLGVSCGLHLIGTPEDVEEISTFPGIIVREVSDETPKFIAESTAGSILYAEDQLVKYKLVSYYSEEPEWWKNRYSLKTAAAGIYTTIGPESPYSESSAFQDPRCFEPISPYFVHQINPDDRIYKIYIQMSADLVMTAYERSNFFITIRNTNSKMSIKNFLKYLS